MAQYPVSAEGTTTVLTVEVTAAPYDAVGQTIPNTDASSSIDIWNPSSMDIVEFLAPGGSWTPLKAQTKVTIDIDMSSAMVSLRRGIPSTSPMSVEVTVEGLPTSLVAVVQHEGDVAVEIAGGSQGAAGSGLTNFNLGNYPSTRRAIGNLRAGISGFNVLCVGDSTTVGVFGPPGSTVDTAHQDCIRYSWVGRAAEILSGNGLQAGWQNWFGDHMENIHSSDPRVGAIPSGWASIGIGPSVSTLYSNNSTTNAWTFAPTVPTDTFFSFWLDQPGYDSVAVKSGVSAANAALTGAATPATGTQKIRQIASTYTLGQNVWSVGKATSDGSQLIYVGCSAINSTKPEISLLNLGASGQKLEYFLRSGAYWKPFETMTANESALISPLAIINIGINDYGNGTPLTTFQSELQALTNGLLAAGTEILFVIPVPSASSVASLAMQSSFAAAIRTVAAGAKAAVVDMPARWKSNADSAAYYYGDSIVHPNAAGYADMGSAIAQFFLAF